MSRKKIDLTYMLFALFAIVILASFFYMLKINQNTKNNYLSIGEIEQLKLLNKEFDVFLNRRLQYLDSGKIASKIDSFEQELDLLSKIAIKNITEEKVIHYYKEVKEKFSYKTAIINDFKSYNTLLVESIHHLLKLQVILQKRYYFSPIGYEVNNVIVNFTQSALGEIDYIHKISKNLKDLKGLIYLNKLTDIELDTFIKHSYSTISYLNKLNSIVQRRYETKLALSLDDLRTALIVYFEDEAAKEQMLFYALFLIIFGLLIIIVITYGLDKNHKLELLRFRKAVENSDNSILITDANRNITYVNSAFEKITGYSEKEVFGQNPRILNAGIKEKKYYDELNKKLSQGKKWKGEFINKSKNGKIFYEKASIVPIFIDKELDGFLAIKLDVTKDIKQKEELLDKTKKLNEAQKIAHLGSWEFDLVNNKQYWSDEVYRIFGIKPGEVETTYETFLSFVHPNDKDMVDNYYKNSIKEKKGYSIEHRVMTKDGRILYVKNRCKHKFNERGEAVKSTGIILDITLTKKLEIENKQKENMMFQQSKMAAMGEMLENIAHQWRQPLSVITTAASGMKFQKEFSELSDEAFIDSVDGITSAAKHLSQTIDDFRDFFKSNKEKTILNLKKSFERTIGLISSKFKNREIEIIKNMEDIELTGLESELIQAFMNILTNSQDAIENLQDCRKLIFVDIYEKDNYAVIKIKDNGDGIPENIIKHIFEPYFTTKHQSQGTGIGLYMTYEIIVKHLHGSIKANNIEYEFEGTKYKGAQFIIRLPIE